MQTGQFPYANSNHPTSPKIPSINHLSTENLPKRNKQGVSSFDLCLQISTQPGRVRAEMQQVVRFEVVITITREPSGVFRPAKYTHRGSRHDGLCGRWIVLPRRPRFPRRLCHVDIRSLCSPSHLVGLRSQSAISVRSDQCIPPLPSQNPNLLTVRKKNPHHKVHPLDSAPALPKPKKGVDLRTNSERQDEQRERQDEQRERQDEQRVSVNHL